MEAQEMCSVGRERSSVSTLRLGFTLCICTWPDSAEEERNTIHSWNPKQNKTKHNPGCWEQPEDAREQLQAGVTYSDIWSSIFQLLFSLESITKELKLWCSWLHWSGSRYCFDLYFDFLLITQLSYEAKSWHVIHTEITVSPTCVQSMLSYFMRKHCFNL